MICSLTLNCRAETRYPQSHPLPNLCGTMSVLASSIHAENCALLKVILVAKARIIRDLPSAV